MKTKTLEFYGYSDDIAYAMNCNLSGNNGEKEEISLHVGDERAEVLLTDDGCCQHCGHKANPGGGAMIVSLQYSKRGTWSVGIAPATDDKPMPEWPMRFEFKAYSTYLYINVPESTKARVLYPED